MRNKKKKSKGVFPGRFYSKKLTGADILSSKQENFIERYPNDARTPIEHHPESQHVQPPQDAEELRMAKKEWRDRKAGKIQMGHGRERLFKWATLDQLRDFVKNFAKD